VSFLLDTLSSVSVLVVVVLGMAVIVSMMGIFNLAHGQFVLLGAVGYLFFERRLGAGFLAIALAVMGAAAVGAVVEVAVIRRLLARPIAAVLATFGIGLVISELVRLAIGNAAQGVAAPIAGTVTLGSYQAEAWRLWIVALAIFAVAATFFLIERTELGLRMRATLMDPALARASGVRARRVYTCTFALGTALAAFAGALLAPLTSVFPELGVSYLVLSFLAVMVGGPGTFIGPVIGAVLLGTALSILERGVSPTYAQVLVVVGAVVFMRIRPHGIVGSYAGLTPKET
jgi:branched-chain amino acid transport system permease protein